VLERELTLLVEGAEHVVGPDRLVRVGPAVRRQLVNAGTGAPRPARPRRIRGPREPRRPRLDFVGGRRARCTTAGDPAARRPTDRLSRRTGARAATHSNHRRLIRPQRRRQCLRSPSELVLASSRDRRHRRSSDDHG
jgi:hypothetical protein